MDDLASAIVALPGIDGWPRPPDVTIDGRVGKLVEYVDPRGHRVRWTASSRCERPNGRSFWEVPPYGDTVRTWILDVDGSRFVIMAESQPGRSDADVADWPASVESVDVRRERTGGSSPWQREAPGAPAGIAGAPCIRPLTDAC